MPVANTFGSSEGLVGHGAPGKTVLTLRQLHPSRERRQTAIGFGAVEYGLQTLDGLEAWLAG